MDKIVEKLQALGISAQDLDDVKNAFNEAVDARVKAETDLISERAEAYIALQVDERAKVKEKEINDLSEKYLAIKTATIAKNASLKLNEQVAEVQKKCEEYIQHYVPEAFSEQYEKELALMEESILEQLDRYLDYAITEKISPDLIKSAAVNETFAPIIKGIQNLFQEQYVPLNTSGNKKLKEAQATIAELEETLKAQINENMELTDKTEKYAKRALLAEKTVDLSRADAANVKKFFADKSFATTKADVDSYVGMIKESTRRIQEAREQAVRDSKVQMVERRSLVAESAKRDQKPAKFSKSFVEDNTNDFVNERIKTRQESKRLDETSDDYLTSVAKYVEM